MPQQQEQPREAQQQQPFQLPLEARERPVQPEQEPQQAPEALQAMLPEAASEAPPEAAADQEAEQDEASPKAGRRRRRRRHRRGAAAAARDSSDDESGPSQDGASTHQGASPPANPNRNVVTWSDLGGDSVLKRALPVGRVVHGASPQQCGVQVASPQQCAAPPVVFFAAPQAQVWPIQWHCPRGATEAQGPHDSCVPQNSVEVPWGQANTVWTDKHSHELRRWLCGSFGGTGVPPQMSDLADMLQDLAQEAYED